MVEVPYAAEEILQELLADYPGLLAGDDAGTDTDWLLIQREIGIAESEDENARWSLDHLFVDRKGIPTLVEVKRSTDSRIRREVVGQMLDYAANGSAVWSQESIKASFEAGAEREGKDPDSELGRFLREDEDSEIFWKRVGENLKLGKLRLVFVADSIPRELRRVIEFLNEQMEATEVIGIEVKQFAEEGGDATTLMSSVIGRTEAARQVKGGTSPSSRGAWAVEDFEEELRNQHSADLAGRVMRLHHRLIEAGAEIKPGTGTTGPSMNYRLAAGTETPVSLSIYMSGVAINFGFVNRERSEEDLWRLVAHAAKIPGAGPFLSDVREGRWNLRPTLLFGDVMTDDASADLIADQMIAASMPEPSG